MTILEERRRLGAEEIEEMLRRYFLGPITREVVDRLVAHINGLLDEPRRVAAEKDKFNGSFFRRGYGFAWREELAFHVTRPSSIAMAAWLAFSGAGYPAPRRYCPEGYCGRWQASDPASTWELHPDGRFVCDEPFFARRVLWCVHRDGMPPPIGDLWLYDELAISPMMLTIRELSATALHVAYLDGTFNGRPYRLTRVG